MSNVSGQIGFVLAAPPLTSGTRTLNMTLRAGTALGYGSVSIANLFALPMRNTGDLDVAGATGDGWAAARPALESLLLKSEVVFAAWGLGKCSGPARLHKRAQILWLVTEARRCGHTEVWTLAGEPRHPSRWHQYLGDQHGRAGAGGLEARLGRNLRRVSVGDLVSL